MVKRFAGSIYGGVWDEPVGIITKHRAILEWVEREFLGRKAVEARKRKYMPGRH
ncbi:hypothetical protein X802_09160 [Thermococcus guaymasensis DSM 11113]|uniref:Uncharacterized protein n=1 Tax=Thermococcus guaymasensis DSM 11113 TaxID=1432656 RepID=A0A0X1KNL4_9EURY|nr:hypothetical protein X802_09160 [Thermococcus guaymasensis DSM 11113]